LPDTEADTREPSKSTPLSTQGASFAREVARLARQAERWTSGAVGKRLPAIRAVAVRARRDPRLAPAAAMRALWALARSPGNR